MRNVVVLAILVGGAMLAAAPATAQTYDPRYPVCMQIVPLGGGNTIDCGFTFFTCQRSVALFGPSGDIEWGPWQVPHRIVTSAHTCRPCGRDGCGGGKRSECLEVIAPQQVLDAIRSLLEETG